MDDKIKSLLVPNPEQRQRRLDTFKQFACYGVIALIEIITIFVIPIIAGGITTNNWDYWIPTTKMGWFCWWAMKIGTVIGNLAVFGLFKAQGKVNAKDNKKYIEAKEKIASQNGKKGFIPQSPGQYQAKSWGTKGAMTFIITAAESLVIGSLILMWDLATFISCIVSGVTACIFGIIQMIKDEVYWTEEYPLYVDYVVKQEQDVVPEKESNENA